MDCDITDVDSFDSPMSPGPISFLSRSRNGNRDWCTRLCEPCTSFVVHEETASTVLTDDRGEGFALVLWQDACIVPCILDECQEDTTTMSRSV